MPVPLECTGFEPQIAELEAAIVALHDDLAGKNRPPNEPRLSFEQKQMILKEIKKKKAALDQVRHDFAVCVHDHTPPAPADTTPALGVSSIMVTQSIQSGTNRIRLIRNRPTAVRVFVESGVDNGFNAGAGPNRWPAVTGDLRVTDLDSGTMSGFVQPFNAGGVITAVPRSELSIDNGSHSLNFRLPQSALSGRRLEITARVWVTGRFADGDGWTATGSTTVTLVDRVAQEVTPLLIIDTAAGIPAPTFATYVSLLRRGALARLPVPFFTVNPPITFPVANNLMSVLGWADMMAGLTTLTFIGRPSGGIRTGIVGPSPTRRPVGGMGVPRILFTTPTFVAQTDEDLFAHEMGHTHGLNHAICRGDEPWQHDDRLPGRTDQVGMHIEDGTVLPRGTPELMSYCSAPTWPSNATYDLVFDNPA
jgi:hypothetical protein